MDKFAFKYTLYYMPYYILGYWFGQLSKIGLIKTDKKYFTTIGVMAIIYSYLMLNYNFHLASDILPVIVLRYICSVTGCVLAIYLLSNWKSGFGKLHSVVHWAGVNSLELYIIHFFYLRILKASYQFSVLTLDGFIIEALNFILCAIASVLTILVIKNTPIIYKYLFYRF